MFSFLIGFLIASFFSFLGNIFAYCIYKTAIKAKDKEILQLKTLLNLQKKYQKIDNEKYNNISDVIGKLSGNTD